MSWYLLCIGKNDKNAQGFTKHLGPREKINLNHYEFDCHLRDKREIYVN